MRTHTLKLKAHRGAGMRAGRDGEMEVLGQELSLRKTFMGRDVAEDAHGLAALVAEYVLVPRDVGAAVGAEEVVFVSGVVLEAEVVVVFGKLSGLEAFVIGLAFAAHVAGAPACVEELPRATVNLDGVPGMVGALRREGCPAAYGDMAEAFAVTVYDYAF